MTTQSSSTRPTKEDSNALDKNEKSEGETEGLLETSETIAPTSAETAVVERHQHTY